MISKKTYKCHNCGVTFRRYQSTCTNEETICCSRKCADELKKEKQKGKRNTNFRNGSRCFKSYCACGKEKDYRAVKCSLCSKKGYPKDKTQRITEKEIRNAVQTSTTYLEVISKTGLSSNYIRKLVKKYGINISHFKPCKSRPAPAEKILCVGHKRRNSAVKKFLLKNNLIPYRCEKCANTGNWLGSTLMLELEHKNGDCTDNRLENLTFLCPNCHSQTTTHRGRNNGRKKKGNSKKGNARRQT